MGLHQAGNHSAVGFRRASFQGQFNIFTNYLGARLKGMLRKFADDTELGGAADSLKGREALQTDLNKSESWAITSL